MPLDPLIYVGLRSPLPAEAVRILSEDIVKVVGSYPFDSIDEPVAIVVSPWCDLNLLNSSFTCLSYIEVSTACAYYGPGYERGEWPMISSILKFLRERLPDSLVVYGPDSGEDVEVVNDEFLLKMWRYWNNYGTEPYYSKRKG